MGDAIDVMIKRASAHPRDAQAFQAVIRRYLEGQGAVASPVALAAPGAPDAQELVRGVGEVRRALAAELARLKADLAASPPNSAVAEQAARSVRELTQAVKGSAGARREVRLPAAAGSTAPNALSLGAVMELNRAWADALGNYDRDMFIEQFVSVVSIANLGVSYLTISAGPLDSTGVAIRSATTVATALDLGSFAFEYTFTTNAREQVNALPHEMALTLAPELANLWRLAQALERTVRGQLEAAPAAITAAVEAPDAESGDQVEITMGDGSVLKGQLEAAKIPFVSGYGTIEVATSAITSLAEGRLTLEDGSVLKGAFGDGDLSLSTSQGALRVPAREVVAMSRGGTSEPAADKAPPAVAPEQAVLIGRVLDRFNQPIAAATVRIIGSNLRTATDSSGNYRLPYVPGKFRLTIEKEGYDSEQFDIELAQSATFPVEEKFLTSVPDRSGLYFWGKLDWLPTSPCRIEQAEKDSGDAMRGGVNRFVALGKPSIIVHDGTAYFLDMSGAEQIALLPVAADGTILRIVREGGFAGFGAMWMRTEPDEIEKAAVSLKEGTIGNNRRILSAELKPGVYAFVSRSVSFGFGAHQSLPTGICYMFELRTAAQVEEAHRRVTQAEAALSEERSSDDKAALTAETIIGSWSGTVDQPGFDKYPITINIESPETGETDYPTLKCGGTLLGDRSGSSFTYTETITYGQDRCISEGKITLRLLGINELQWEYFHPTGGTASARLNRIISSQQTSRATAATRWRVVIERARVRAAPSTGAEILATLPPGTLLPLAAGADPEAEWLAVSLDGRDAFIATRLTRPAVAPQETIDGAARVADTATLEIGNSVVRLFGIAGEGGDPAQGMALFVEEQGGRVSCSHKEMGRYTCQLGGRDIAEVALFNGAARAAADAPESYRQREAQAREAGRGIWAH